MYTEAYSCYLEILKLIGNEKNVEELTMKGIALLNLSILFQSINDTENLFYYMKKADQVFLKLKNNPVVPNSFFFSILDISLRVPDSIYKLYSHKDYLVN